VPSTKVFLHIETAGGVINVLPVNITVSINGPLPPVIPECIDAQIITNFTLIDQFIQDPTLSPLYATQANSTTPLEMAERVFTI
jgi:hypothetical protein